MNVFAARQSRRLLFRTYLIIVGGLIVIATVLDFSFYWLQGASAPATHRWIDTSLTLIETHLSQLPAEERPAAVERLEQQLGFPVRVLPPDHIVPRSGSEMQEVFDADGRSAFFRTSAKLDSVIQIGPVALPESSDGLLIKLIPPLFYLSIFVFVGLWLWPLLRDLNLLTQSAREFAADYRRPMQTFDKTTSLRELAKSLDEMSARIRDLIQGQKELTGALSHEMRTPLARIKFAMAMLSQKPNISEELQSIEQDMREIDELINTMLDYARLDHPDTEINYQLTPIDAWLEQAVAKCRLRTDEIRIETDAPAGRVRMDPYLMEVALSNLLINACRYARQTVRVRFTLADGRCLLGVEDDGEGIPEASRQFVFKAFTRLDSSRNRETGGFGLGLAIVARIAALHQGSAWAEQSALGGARIVIAWDGGRGDE